jgi:hypothetical protein
MSEKPPPNVIDLTARRAAKKPRVRCLTILIRAEDDERQMSEPQTQPPLPQAEPQQREPTK